MQLLVIEALSPRQGHCILKGKDITTAHTGDASYRSPGEGFNSTLRCWLTTSYNNSYPLQDLNSQQHITTQELCMLPTKAFAPKLSF